MSSEDHVVLDDGILKVGDNITVVLYFVSPWVTGNFIGIIGGPQNYG